MTKETKTIIGILCLIILAIGLSQPEIAFAKRASGPCPCEEEYKSEKGYSLYKEAAQDWKGRKWSKAVEKYQEIIEKYPSSPLAAKSHMGTGLFLKYHGLYDEAIPEFEKGISMMLHTRDARDARTSVACIHTLQGKYDEALAILREVLSQAEDWDQVKYCSYWMKEICRLKAHGYAELKACGPRVLATILRLKGIKYSKKELSTLLPGDNIRTSMQDLKKAAEAKGLKATGVKLTLAQLRNVEMPVIALAKPDHYLVISSAGKNGFEAIDPVRGERSYTVPEAALQKRWTGKVLLFTDKKPCQARYALLTKDAMESSFGGVCDCCPDENLGDESENVEYDDPPAIWVNTVNLNMILKDTDLSYSGLGPSVEIVRAYNADDSRQSAFGRSWTFNYNIYLTEEPSGDVLVNRGSGKIDRFYYVGSSSTDMSGTWNVTLVCTDTNCPDWSDVGNMPASTIKITQSGNDLTGHLYDPCCPISGTVDGNSFNLSGYWTETDEGCIIRNDLLIEGTVDGNSFSATTTITLTPLEPVDPNCAGMIGSGCEEVFFTIGVRKVSDTGYITYEPGVYDTLIKNGDGTCLLKIKEDKTTQHFDPNGILTSIVDRSGNALSFGYDTNSNLTTITDAAGRVTTFSYDANDHIIAITDPIGRSTSYIYDADDNLISSTDMAGYITNYTYDQYSYMTAITTPKGTTTISNVYDEEYGYAINSITNAMGHGRWYGTYWTSGEDNVMVTDAHGNTTYYDNLDYGVTGAITNPLGNTTSFGYDIFGNRISVTNANKNTTNSTYDERGNITSIADPLGNVTSFTYDANDNLIQLKDALNRTYSYTYDANDNLTKVADPLGKQTNFTYDSHGQLTGLTDAKSNTTSFAYNPNGNLVSSTDPCGHSTNYTYDGVGRLLSRTDAKGNTITYTYDGLDRVTEVNYPDGNIVYAYDSSSLTSITDKDSQITTFEYDSLNRMTRVTHPDGHTIQYSYDWLGNRISITYPDGRMVWYNYDYANRLARVKDFKNDHTLYTYDPAGNLTSMKYLPYGIVTTYLYDNASRFISLETKKSDDSIICSYQYTLDAVGSRVAIEANAPLEPNIAFGDVKYTYNQDNQLLTANEITFTYDENGNLIQKIEDGNTTTYTYDYDNRLIQFVTPENTYQYEYDPLGSRIAKTKDGVTTRYFVDLNRLLPQVLAEADEYGNIQNAYVYGLGLISKVDQEWDAYYYHYDGIGSTVAITDQASNIVNKYAYTPFGMLAGIEESIPNPFRYIGRFGVMDDENGLLYMRARYYNPKTGRFLTKDPIHFVAGINPYSYVMGNPMNLVDPLGLMALEVAESEEWEWYSEYGFWFRARKVKETEDLTASEMIQLLLHILGENYNSLPLPSPPIPYPSDPRYEIDEDSLVPASPGSDFPIALNDFLDFLESMEKIKLTQHLCQLGSIEKQCYTVSFQVEERC